MKIDTVKGSQLLQPLFEFSGACAGCGETPYLKLLTQLFGERTVVANATGCSSIFGGNLPTTPWSTNAEGRGPAWSNSLFEDNAEFGLGIRLALDSKFVLAERLLESLASQIGDDLVKAISDAAQLNETEIAEQRQRVEALRRKLAEIDSPAARELAGISEVLVRRSMWIVGGDGWAYDIGYGGLDHVLASGRDVNVLVLDTGVYSNTGGQASKATPRAATAKFAANGRDVHRKDLGMMAVTYGNVYVAQIAVGANPAQTVRAFQEAESYHGPSFDSGLQPLHRTWHRHVHVDDSSERLGEVSVLASIPLRSPPCSGGRASFPPRQSQADAKIQRRGDEGSSICHVGSVESDTRETLDGAGPERHRRHMALLQADGRSRP